MSHHPPKFCLPHSLHKQWKHLVEATSTVAAPFILRTPASVIAASIPTLVYTPATATVPLEVEALSTVVAPFALGIPAAQIMTVPVQVEALSTVVASFPLSTRTPASLRCKASTT